MNKKRMDSNIGANHTRAINPFLASVEEQVVRTYRPRLFGYFESSEDFLYTLEILETASENDVVELHIQSGGGDLDSVDTLTHAMSKCAGHIHLVYTGRNASAATIPLFFADTVECSPTSSFLFHEAILGSAPETMSASKKYFDFTYVQCKEMLADLYKGFLTEEEMARLFQGEQLYFRGEEVMTRMNKRNEILSAFAEQDEKGEETEYD
jgi:ATP-dependent protease ClpP protease subunit